MAKKAIPAVLNQLSKLGPIKKVLPVANTYKGVFFFSSFKKGWTETWAMVGDSFDSAKTLFTKFAPFLIAPRSQHTNLDGCRIVQVDPPLPRKGFPIGFTLVGSRMDPALPSLEAQDLQDLAAFYRVEGVDDSHKSTMLRGLADVDTDFAPVSGGGFLAPPARALTDAIFNFAIVNHLGYLHSNLTPADAFNVISVKTDPANGQYTLITCDEPVTIGAGAKVHFTGVPLKTLPWLKGQWLAKAVAGDTLSIAYVYPLAGPTLPVKMQLWPTSLVFTAVIDKQFTDLRRRITGRPIELSRGRSRGIPFRR